MAQGQPGIRRWTEPQLGRSGVAVGSFLVPGGLGKGIAGVVGWATVLVAGGVDAAQVRFPVEQADSDARTSAATYAIMSFFISKMFVYVA